jgi:molybdate transport system substrate-binding protein
MKLHPPLLPLIVVLSTMTALLPYAHGETFTVFAAASLSTALEDITKAHEKKTGDRVRTSYAASSALARQIENGAPADVFVSADLAWMDYLQKKGLIQPATRFEVVRNRLVLIAPAGAVVKLEIAPGFALAAALGTSRLATADPASVPAGRYAREALENLGVWKSVEAKIAAAQDVRAALLLVARGETPLGVVYSTDAAVEPRVKVVGTFPDNTHAPIVYPAALVATSKSAAAARFLQVLREPAAYRAFERYGFKEAPGR